MEFYQFLDLESLHFPQNVVNSKSGREMVMKNQEIVMEKSWKNILSSLGTLFRGNRPSEAIRDRLSVRYRLS